MKFFCDGEDLKAAVAIVSRGTSPKTLNPILEGIKITAEKDTVTFFATDLELYLRKTIHADVKQDGCAVLPGKLFGEYIAKIGSGPIAFTSSDTTAVIQHGEGNDGKFSCLPAAEYPDLINLSAAPTFALKSGDLRDVIAKTVLFTAQDNTRPLLRGALLEVDDHNNTLTAVALDGYRLAKVTKPVIRPTASTKIIVPGRALEEMRRMLVDDKEEIDIILENKFVQIALGSTVFASRLIEGDFVNYKQIIPHEFATNVVVETNAFKTAIGRTALLTNSNKVNLLTLSTGANCLELLADSEMGRINERVAANLNGQDLRIAFNSKYFLDALTGITDEFIQLSFNNALAPCVLTSAKPNGDYLFLILPVRLGE